MKKFLFITLLGIFQVAVHAQKDIIGKISFYKYLPLENKKFASSSDTAIQQLNNFKHHIEIIQNGKTSHYRGIENGVFKATINTTDSVTIIINKKSKLLSKTFKMYPPQNKDTLYLKISDQRISNHRDSLRDPEFYKLYNERQAIQDFTNGEAKFLGNGGFLTDEIIEQRDEIAAKYHFKYEYIFGCMTSQTQLRIAHKYNVMMRKLVGIENPWYY